MRPRRLLWLALVPLALAVVALGVNYFDTRPEGDLLARTAGRSGERTLVAGILARGPFLFATFESRRVRWLAGSYSEWTLAATDREVAEASGSYYCSPAGAAPRVEISSDAKSVTYSVCDLAATLATERRELSVEWPRDH